MRQNKPRTLRISTSLLGHTTVCVWGAGVRTGGSLLALGTEAALWRNYMGDGNKDVPDRKQNQQEICLSVCPGNWPYTIIGAD